MENTRERLLEPFPTQQRMDWEERLEEECLALHQNPQLRTKTYEGIDVEPLYTAEDTDTFFDVRRRMVRGEALTGQGHGANGWEIRQDTIVRDFATANARARSWLENGATAIGFDLSRFKSPHDADLQALLKDIDLGKAALHWKGVGDVTGLLTLLQKLGEEKCLSAASLKGSVLADPLGQLTLTGCFRHSFDRDMQDVAALLQECDDRFPGIRTVQVSANHFVEAGASAVQELGYGLSLAAEYFSWLTDQGISPWKIATHLQLNLGTGSQYFFQIAKLRAARILFATFLKSFGIPAVSTASLHIQSITSDWNKTVYGSHVNMLRLTTESMAAVLGGCDSLLVKPYDDSFSTAGDFSERLARNLQTILREEAYFDKVSDPAGGSYYIESITKSLCEKSWELFLETEDKGGFTEVFKTGQIQESVHDIAGQRRQMAATGKDTLLGTNAFPDANETMGGLIEEDIAFRNSSGKTAASRVGGKETHGKAGPVHGSGDPVAMPLLPDRVSVEFEKIRLAVENHHGRTPRAFMLTFGDLHMRLARSQFSCNFFASAGYEVTDNLGFEDMGKGVEEALLMKSDIIVACSSDDEYESAVPEIHDLVNGRAVVVVAGTPPSMDKLRERGIRYFIHRKSDMIDTFKNLNLKLGIQS